MTFSFLYLILVLISGLSFLSYGISLFISKKMKTDFVRFDLKKYTTLVGVLEILGGLGLIIGIVFEIFVTISSFGLATLMLLGVFTRIKVRDNFELIIPALFFLVLNSYIFYESIIK